MKLKYQFAISEVADKKVALVVGEGLKDFKGMLRMNAAGASIFEKLENNITREELIMKVAAEYPDEPPAAVAKEVDGFVGKLIEAGIVE